MLSPHDRHAIKTTQATQVDPGQHGRQLRPRRHVRQAHRNRQPRLSHEIKANEWHRQNLTAKGDASKES